MERDENEEEVDRKSLEERVFAFARLQKPGPHRHTSDSVDASSGLWCEHMQDRNCR